VILRAHVSVVVARVVVVVDVSAAGDRIGTAVIRTGIHVIANEGCGFVTGPATTDPGGTDVVVDVARSAVVGHDAQTSPQNIAYVRRAGIGVVAELGHVVAGLAVQGELLLLPEFAL
jgi:hypothetical protein